MTIILKLKSIFILLIVLSAGLTKAQQGRSTYQNPVVNKSLPDPTVIKAKDGYFYLYATESAKNVPIYKS